MEQSALLYATPATKPLSLAGAPLNYLKTTSIYFVSIEMTSRIWRWYADRQFYKWEKTVLWDMIEPYRRPKSFTPLISIYVAAFYTGVVGSAITEQLYKVFLLVDLKGRFFSAKSLKELYQATITLTRDKQLMGCLYNEIDILPLSLEKYWEDHPGELVPLMRPKFYWGPWRVMNGSALPPEK